MQRDHKGLQEPKATKAFRGQLVHKEFKGHKELKAIKVLLDLRELKELKESRDQQVHKEFKDHKEPRAIRVFKVQPGHRDPLALLA